MDVPHGVVEILTTYTMKSTRDAEEQALKGEIRAWVREVLKVICSGTDVIS